MQLLLHNKTDLVVSREVVADRLGGALASPLLSARARPEYQLVVAGVALQLEHDEADALLFTNLLHPRRVAQRAAALGRRPVDVGLPGHA